MVAQFSGESSQLTQRATSKNNSSPLVKIETGYGSRLVNGIRVSRLKRRCHEMPDYRATMMVGWIEVGVWRLG